MEYMAVVYEEMDSLLLRLFFEFLFLILITR